ncbi:MAG: DUF1599 domain-containing protein [Candidatus Omnitrophica bacterium]|nr:DUF1599 domain-containing protein [Candidatus Omnitrophota bacterium]
MTKKKFLELVDEYCEGWKESSKDVEMVNFAKQTFNNFANSGSVEKWFDAPGDVKVNLVGRDSNCFEGGLEIVCEDLKNLMIRKQADYGHKNITDMGTIGIIVRMNDKMARLKNLHGFTDGSYKVMAGLNESVEDSWRDIANYAIIALMLSRGTFTLPLMKNMENGAKGHVRGD